MNTTIQAIQTANQIQERPDIEPWRIIERASYLKAQGFLPNHIPICPKGGHRCEWDQSEEVLRCPRCQLNCT